MTNSATAAKIVNKEINVTKPHELVKGEQQKDGYGHPVKDGKPPEGDKAKGKDKYGYGTFK